MNVVLMSVCPTKQGRDGRDTNDLRTLGIPVD